MSARPDVVDYLRENLSKFPVETLRRQLSAEGVSAADFDESLAEALRAPKTATAARPAAAPRKGAKMLVLAMLALVVAAGLIAVARKPSAPAAKGQDAGSAGESGFVGARGWIVRMPKDYAGVSQFKDPARTTEVVHFCPRGTDPTHFLNEGLFGQMGIVRLTVAENRFPATPAGAAALSERISRDAASRGEKFVLKNIQVGALNGVQVNIQSPFPRVEAYLLGQRDLYFFYGGQADEIWRDIVMSLRDPRSES